MGQEENREQRTGYAIMNCMIIIKECNEFIDGVEQFLLEKQKQFSF